MINTCVYTVYTGKLHRNYFDILEIKWFEALSSKNSFQTIFKHFWNLKLQGLQGIAWTLTSTNLGDNYFLIYKIHVDVTVVISCSQRFCRVGQFGPT